MSFRFNPKNSTYVLMQHQENMHFAKRLKSVKPTVDNKHKQTQKPKQKAKAKSSKGKINNLSNVIRKREIDYQNKVLLSKMMGILKRRNKKRSYEMTMPPMGSLIEG